MEQSPHTPEEYDSDPWDSQEFLDFLKEQRILETVVRVEDGKEEES